MIISLFKFHVHIKILTLDHLLTQIIMDNTCLKLESNNNNLYILLLKKESPNIKNMFQAQLPEELVNNS